MTIEEKDFRLTPLKGTSQFNLELVKTVKPRGGEAREEFDDPLYGLPLDSCISRIIHHRTQRKLADQTTDLKTYMTEYKVCQKEIMDIFKVNLTSNEESVSD